MGGAGPWRKAPSRPARKSPPGLAFPVLLKSAIRSGVQLPGMGPGDRLPTIAPRFPKALPLAEDGVIGESIPLQKSTKGESMVYRGRPRPWSKASSSLTSCSWERLGVSRMAPALAAPAALAFLSAAAVLGFPLFFCAEDGAFESFFFLSFTMARSGSHPLAK